MPDGEAITFSCDAAGDLSPADPDGFILAAEWTATDEALVRLAAVDWYDVRPLRRWLATNEAFSSRGG